MYVQWSFFGIMGNLLDSIHSVIYILVIGALKLSFVIHTFAILNDAPMVLTFFEIIYIVQWFKISMYFLC